MESFIEVVIDNNNIEFLDHGSFESRSSSTMKLFIEGLRVLQRRQLKTQKFYISTADISRVIHNSLTFGFTQEVGVISIPDYVFLKWPEVGIFDYDETISEIFLAGEDSYRIEKLFWIGNLQTQALRSKLWSLGQLHKDKFEIISMEWMKAPNGAECNLFSQFVSLKDHTKFKYLIDCGAKGYSGRLKFLLFTNRPLFLVSRPPNMKDHFYDDLVPYKHFIPVKEDLSDLLSQYEWAELNSGIVNRIARNAREYAITNLTRTSALKFLASRIEQYLCK